MTHVQDLSHMRDGISHAHGSFLYTRCHILSYAKHIPQFLTTAGYNFAYGSICHLSYETRCAFVSQWGHHSWRISDLKIWISKSNSCPVRSSIEWRGLPFTPVKTCLECWKLPCKFLWNLRGLPWKFVRNFGRRNYFGAGFLRPWYGISHVSHIGQILHMGGMPHPSYGILFAYGSIWHLACVSHLTFAYGTHFAYGRHAESIHMGHVLHMGAYGILYMCRISHSHCTFILTIASCHTYVWVMSKIWTSHIICTNTSRHIRGWVMSRLYMSHVRRVIESCHKYGCVRRRYKSYPYLWMRHVTHTNET